MWMLHLSVQVAALGSNGGRQLGVASECATDLTAASSQCGFSKAARNCSNVVLRE